MTMYCYAQRMLNPFRGVINVIEYLSAEAVTTNGIHWDIYVRNDELLNGLEYNQKVQTSEIRYGSWSVEAGLVRGPIFPSDDFTRLEKLGAQVYEYLLQVHDRLPFEFHDKYELWLLDRHHAPIALLDSVLDINDIANDIPLKWRAGQAAQKHFSHAGASSLQEPAHRVCAADYLTSYINKCASTSPAAQWFYRENDGTGMGLQGINIDNKLENRILPDQAFPPLLLATSPHDRLHSPLVEAYLDWQAPWLLLLPHLSRDLRHKFEQLARRQALIVAEQYRLYPEIIDQSMINAARVEAMLRSSLPQQDSSEQVMSTDYIELYELDHTD